MAKSETDATLDALVGKIGELAQAASQNAPKRKVTLGEYMRRRPRRAETVKVIAAGHAVDVNRLSPEDYALLPKLLTKAGRFYNGRVLVRVKSEERPPVVRIEYPCSDVRQRMENQTHWKSFSELLNHIAKTEPTAK